MEVPTVSKLHWMMVGLFVVALGTGVLVGMGLSHEVKPHDRTWSWLTEELKLTSEQSEKIKVIWSDMLQGPGQRPGGEPRRAAQKERDDAIVALLTPEQKGTYDKIIERYNQQVGEMNKAREAAFQAAVEKTKAVLDANQRAKYEELLKKGFHGSPREHGPRGAGTQASTQGAGGPAATQGVH